MITIADTATLGRVLCDCAIRSTGDSAGVAIASTRHAPLDLLGTVRTMADALGFVMVPFDASAGTPKALARGQSPETAYDVMEREHVDAAAPRLFVVAMADHEDAGNAAALVASVVGLRADGAPTIALVITTGEYDGMANAHDLMARALKVDADDVIALRF